MDVSKGIKVLYVTHYRELYGANNSMLQMILELQEKGIQPTVLLPDYEIKPNNDLGIELDRYGIARLEAKIRFDKHSDWKKAALSYIRTIFFRKDVAKAIEEIDFDIVHSNSSIISAGAYIARKSGKPHVWHLREFGNLDYGLVTPFGKWYQKIIYQGNNTFIAISKSIKKNFSRWIGKQDIRVIYNGIKPSPHKETGINNPVQICVVGLIQPWKAQIQLIEAADILINHRHIKNLHITLIGNNDTDYAEKINRFVDTHGLSEYVTLTGRRNDVPEILTKMDIGVMTSLNEAFGRTTVEYMMAGLAVIASDGGANTEIIEDGVTGLIYKSGNTLQLADKIELLMKDRVLCEKIAINGQIYAEKNFSSKSNSDAVFRLYNEILNQI